MRKVTRTRTGCLTCRRRKVKCDERKPTCYRCDAVNVVCDGYGEKRRVSSSPSSTASRAVRLSGDTILHNPDVFPEASSNTEVLYAYHQYITSTVVQLFRADQLYFWRDRVLKISWTTEIVFEAIKALGAIHRANMIPSSGIAVGEVQRLRVLGLDAYGKALRMLSRELEKEDRSRNETLMIVLLLLNIFEVGRPLIAQCKANCSSREPWETLGLHSSISGLPCSCSRPQQVVQTQESSSPSVRQ